MKTIRTIFAVAVVFLLFAIGIASAIPTPEVPTVDFTQSPAGGGVAPSTVTFHAILDPSGGLATHYTWAFGDGNTAENIGNPNVAYTYTTPGVYTVTLVASDTVGFEQWSVGALPQYVHVFHPEPVVTVAADPEEIVGGIGETIQVTATSPATFIEGYGWYLDDVFVVNTSAATYPFQFGVVTAPTPHEIYVVAYYDEGYQGTDSNTVTVTVNPQAPVASFTASTQVGVKPLVVNFDASESTGFELKYKWDYGDGNGTAFKGDATKTHTYTEAGTYTVNLNVSSTGGKYGYDEASPITILVLNEATDICPECPICPEPTICPELPAIKQDKIGVYQNGGWYLDLDGSGGWTGGDAAYSFGAPGYTPVLGDWNGDGTTKIGVYKDGAWYLDYLGEGVWTSNTKAYGFGAVGFTPVVGDWNTDGSTEIGVYKNGIWYLDFNGNGAWDTGTDLTVNFGSFGFTPVVGKWV